MRVSLPVRLFLVHLIFTVGAGAVAVFLVGRSFERYNESWRREVTASFTTKLYSPMAAEVARSLLLAQEAEFPEVREERRTRIAEGLRAVLAGLPNLRSVVVVDSELRIQFASDPSVQDLTYLNPADRRFLESDSPSRRSRPTKTGSSIEEIVIPVFEERGPAGAARRLGAVLVRFVPDPALAERATSGGLPDIPPRDFALPVVLFLAAAAAAAIAVAALTGLPVQRLDRALSDLKARGFRGGLDAAGLGADRSLLSAVQTINELGGRLEALDARGREREALLEKLSQSLEEGMLALTPRGEPVAWNPALLRILGAPSAPEPPRPSEVGFLKGALARNPGLLPPGGSAREDELALLRADGTSVAVKVASVPFETGTLLLLRDLGTLRTIETHLVEAGRFAVLASLTAGLAHEIRNPLHSIGLNATVVEEYAAAERTPERLAAMSESLVIIKEETQRLAELLNSYLGLVRPETAAGPADLGEICRRVMRLVSFTARRSHVDIRLEGIDGLPMVHGIADRLQQAVLNLVLNAIQAMPEGGAIALEAHESNGMVRLRVSDTGPGVPEGLETSLFETGVTTKTHGTGLGLPLVRLIVESHGGTVSYSPSPGRGATFTLALPCSGRNSYPVRGA